MEISNEIADALNRGTIKNSNSQHFTDLVFTHQVQGEVSLLLQSENDFSGQSTMLSGGSTILGQKKHLHLPSNVQVFTREGRHLAGTPLNQRRYCKTCYE